MLTKEEKLRIYREALAYFENEKADPPGDGDIGMGMCPKLKNLCNEPISQIELPNYFPEWYSLRPTLEQRRELTCDSVFWFELDDWDSRIEVLTKAIAICEAS